MCGVATRDKAKLEWRERPRNVRSKTRDTAQLEWRERLRNVRSDNEGYGTTRVARAS